MSPRLLAAAIVMLTAIQTFASTMTFSVPAHEIIVGGGKGGTRVLHVVLAEDRLQAHVVVDVYSLPNVRSTERHLEELRTLPRATWFNEIAWDVRDSSGRAIAIKPQLLKSAVRDGGGAAWRQRPRDLKSYSASFDLGRLPPGDYTFRTLIRGLSSSKLNIAVRTGDEPEIREMVAKLKKK